MLSVELKPELEQHFANIAKESGLSVSECMHEAIVSFLEDFEDVRLAEEVWARHEEEHSHEEVKEECNLKD